MDIVVWLRKLGLGKYEAAFRENDIDETCLASLHPGRADRSRHRMVGQSRTKLTGASRAT